MNRLVNTRLPINSFLLPNKINQSMRVGRVMQNQKKYIYTLGYHPRLDTASLGLLTHLVLA